MIDWQKAYLDVLAYKERKGLANVVIRPEMLRKIIESGGCRVRAEDSTLRPDSFERRVQLQDAVTQVLCRYLDRFYQLHRQWWEEGALDYKSLVAESPILAFNRELTGGRAPAYKVEIPRFDGELLEAVRQLLDEERRLYEQENSGLPRICFARHLYQPLLVSNDKLKITPPGLNKGEKKFVEDLRSFCEQEKNNFLAGKEVFVLRNLSRGAGIGFFETRHFYPDFVLWILSGTHQRIVFVDPHGMWNAPAYEQDEKARLHESLPALGEKLAKRSKHKNVALDSFIISVTPYEELRTRYEGGSWDRQKFAEAHILFQEERRPEYDYIRILLG